MRSFGVWHLVGLLIVAMGVYTGCYLAMIGGNGKCAPPGPYYHLPTNARSMRRDALAYKVAKAFFAPAYWVDSRIRPKWFGEDSERAFFK